MCRIKLHINIHTYVFLPRTLVLSPGTEVHFDGRTLAWVQFFSSRISTLSLLMTSLSLLNFSLLLCIVFLIFLNCLSVFNSPSFLKTTILNYLLGKLQITISLGLIIEKLSLCFLWWHPAFLIFHVPLILELLPSYLKKHSCPSVFLDCLQERNTFN